MRDKLNRMLAPTLIFIGLISISCSKDVVDTNTCSLYGKVVGYESQECLCCPGWLVEVGNDTLKFETVPETDDLMDMVDFYSYPIPIKFNYKNDTGACSASYKIMTCIELNMDTNCSKSGEIIDYDYTECLCCPGWVIKTGEDTIKVFSLPIENKVREIAETSGYPISIDLDFEDATETCPDIYKKITCIKLN